MYVPEMNSLIISFMFQYHKHIPALRPVCAAVPFAAPFPMVQISGAMADG